MTVTKQDVIFVLKELGIQETDIVIVHSSLKSFGYVDGGADTIIEALKHVVSDGTIVFPTLRLHDFYNAYSDWNVKTTPSDVGFLSERFRLSEGVLRSNQETHSVCAYGKNAKYLTENHGMGENRIGVFGDTPFSKQSPWQKMYDNGAKVVMMGVSMKRNTFKHFVEYKLINDILDNISDEKVKKQAMLKISRFEDTARYYLDGETALSPNGVWLWHDALKSQKMMNDIGKLKKAICGNSTILAFNAQDYVNHQYNAMLSKPDDWFRSDAVEWINEYKSK